MAKQLKVYGWRGFRNDLAPAANGARQSREIVAAYSVAEVLRLTGQSRTDFNHSGTETGNPREVALAVANLGVVMFSSDNGHEQPFYSKGADGTLVEMTADPNLMRAYVLEGRERRDRIDETEAAELAALREKGFVAGVH